LNIETALPTADRPLISFHSPGQWNDLESYQQGKHRLQLIRVVNDTEERGVKLFEEFNSRLTHNEEDNQFLLQVAKANRKVVPTESVKKSVIDDSDT